MSALLVPLVQPAVALALLVLGILEVFAEDLGLPFWAAFVLLVAGTVLWRARRAATLRGRLVSPPPMHVRDVSLATLVEEDVDGKLDGDEATVDDVIRRLRSRRLVVLCGPPQSWHAQIAYEALRKGFADHLVIRPANGAGSAEDLENAPHRGRPATKVLTAVAR